MADEVNLEQHERVAKALEQINGLRYRKQCYAISVFPTVL